MNDEQFEGRMQIVEVEVSQLMANQLRARDTAQREALAEAVGLLREVNSQRFTTPATVEIIESFISRHSQTFHDHAQAKQQEAQGAQAGDERVAFEEWLNEICLSTKRDSSGAYLPHEQGLWEAWQTRAALATQPAVRGAEHE